MQFGEKLQYALSKKEISQTDLANKLGLTPSFISKMINAGKLPGREKLLALSDIFQVTVDYWINDDLLYDKSRSQKEAICLLEEENFIDYVSTIRLAINEGHSPEELKKTIDFLSTIKKRALDKSENKQSS